MNRTHLFMSILTALLLATTACEDEEAEPTPPPVFDTEIIGTWVEPFPFLGMRLTFAADGTARYQADLAGSEGGSMQFTGTYTLGEVISENPYRRKLDITWDSVTPDSMILNFTLPAVDYCLIGFDENGFIIGGYDGDNYCVFGALSDTERPAVLDIDNGVNVYCLKRE